MKTETIFMCVVALILGMLIANMLKDVCGCKVVEGQNSNGVCSGSWSYSSSDNESNISKFVECCHLGENNCSGVGDCQWLTTNDRLCNDQISLISSPVVPKDKSNIISINELTGDALREKTELCSYYSCTPVTDDNKVLKLSDDNDNDNDNDYGYIFGLARDCDNPFVDCVCKNNSNSNDCQNIINLQSRNK